MAFQTLILDNGRMISRLLLFTLLLSSVWGNELGRLHQKAEGAFRNKKYDEALLSYEDLLDKVSTSGAKKYRVGWQPYADLVVRYATCLHELGKTDEAVRAMEKLIARRPPETLLPHLQLRLGQFKARGSPMHAYLEMKGAMETIGEGNCKKEELALFHATTYALNAHFDGQLQKAKRFFAAGHYAQAIPLYEEVRQALQNEIFPKAVEITEKQVRCRLAQCHYLQADYRMTLSLVEAGTLLEDELDREMLYLCALAYKETQNYEDSLECFLRYAKETDASDHRDHALLEVGLYYFKTHNLAKAQRYFSKLQNLRSRPARVAQVYLAKIYLMKNDPQAAEECLLPLAEALPQTDPLLHEVNFLRGRASFSCGAYERASGFFEQSLPMLEQATNWKKEALLLLGRSYMQLGDDPLKEDGIKSNFFDKAHRIFSTLDTDETCLLLQARLALLRHEHLGEGAAVQPLLEERYSTFSIDGQLEALHLLAAAAPPEKRASYLEKACEGRYAQHTKYARNWQLLALHYQEIGEKTQAIAAFEQALLHAPNEQMIKSAAAAHFALGDPSHAFSLLDSIEEPDWEILYLKGLVASTLDHRLAHELFEEVASHESEHAVGALYANATLYFQEKEFEKARTLFGRIPPKTPFADAALFWAAEATELCGQEARALRHELYINHPDSPFAAKSYFRTYPIEAYQMADPEALAHLKAFPFEEHPLLVVTNYLLAMNESNTARARESFERAIAGYRGEHEEFFLRSMLELALSYLTFTQSDEELACAHSTLLDLMQHQGKVYSPLFQEAEFALAQTELKMGHDAEAQKCLARCLQHYHEEGMREGYFLSCVWKEQGKLALHLDDLDTATSCFDLALSTGEKSLGEEQKLDLWILQAECLRKKGASEQAMRLLSKAINADVVCSLRLKAMYLRAEIYEEMGRPELALRQLEAMTKKGGPWAGKAKTKLKERYGIL